jgi:hypothetical protein
MSARLFASGDPRNLEICEGGFDGGAASMYDTGKRSDLQPLRLFSQCGNDQLLE